MFLVARGLLETAGPSQVPGTQSGWKLGSRPSEEQAVGLMEPSQPLPSLSPHF